MPLKMLAMALKMLAMPLAIGYPLEMLDMPLAIGCAIIDVRDEMLRGLIATFAKTEGPEADSNTGELVRHPSDRAT